MTSAASPIIALLPAAGSGQRCGGRKQFAELAAGRSVLWHAVRPFLLCTQVAQVRVVVAKAEVAAAQDALGDLHEHAEKIEILPVGGATRAASVCNGLAAVPAQAWVLVHDAVRPCLSAAALARLLAHCDSGGEEGAALALPQHEALKKVQDGVLTAAVEREDLWAMQTPQVFRAGTLRAALQQHPQAADEAEAVLAAGGTVRVLMGERQNIKITVPEDIQMAAHLLRSMAETAETATAEGGR